VHIETLFVTPYLLCSFLCMHRAAPFVNALVHFVHALVQRSGMHYAVHAWCLLVLHCTMREQMQPAATFDSSFRASPLRCLLVLLRAGVTTCTPTAWRRVKLCEGALCMKCCCLSLICVCQCHLHSQLLPVLFTSVFACVLYKKAGYALALLWMISLVALHCVVVYDGKRDCWQAVAWWPAVGSMISASRRQQLGPCFA
jgi:hypothetical protein